MSVRPTIYCDLGALLTFFDGCASFLPLVLGHTQIIKESHVMDDIASANSIGALGVKLIEAVSGAVGHVAEPWLMIRRARAEGEVALIKDEYEAKLEERAAQRLLTSETRKQRNIEAVAIDAANQLPFDAKPEELDDDWVVNFFNQCDWISDKEMQSLWSRILAGEATTRNRGHP